MSQYSSLCLMLTLLVGKSLGQLSSTAPGVSEGPCNANEKARAATNINLQWIGTPRTSYVIMGSDSSYRNFFEVLRGRPAQTAEELASMKLQVTVLPGGKVFKSTGFNEPDKYYVRQNCSLLPSQSQFFCVPLAAAPDSAPGTDMKSITSTTGTIIYTDNAKYTLLTRCIHNINIQDWKLLSTERTAPVDVQNNIKNIVKNLGFNVNNFRYFPQ